MLSQYSSNSDVDITLCNKSYSDLNWNGITSYGSNCGWGGGCQGITDGNPNVLPSSNFYFSTNAGNNSMYSIGNNVGSICMGGGVQSGYNTTNCNFIMRIK